PKRQIGRDDRRTVDRQLAGRTEHSDLLVTVDKPDTTVAGWCQPVGLAGHGEPADAVTRVGPADAPRGREPHRVSGPRSDRPGRRVATRRIALHRERVGNSRAESCDEQRGDDGRYRTHDHVNARPARLMRFWRYAARSSFSARRSIARWL